MIIYIKLIIKKTINKYKIQLSYIINAKIETETTKGKVENKPYRSASPRNLVFLNDVKRTVANPAIDQLINI